MRFEHCVTRIEFLFYISNKCCQANTHRMAPAVLATCSPAGVETSFGLGPTTYRTPFGAALPSANGLCPFLVFPKIVPGQGHWQSRWRHGNGNLRAKPIVTLPDRIQFDRGADCHWHCRLALVLCNADPFPLDRRPEGSQSGNIIR